MPVDIDERRLLPRYRDRLRLQREQAAVLARVLETLDTDTPTTTDTRGYRPTPADAKRIRGIPAFMSGATGATNGTNPERALIRKQPRDQ